MELFKIFGTIAVNSDEAKKGIKDAEEAADKAQSGMSKAFDKIGSAAVAAGKLIATGLAAGTVAMGKLMKDSIASYSEYEQLVGGVETLYGASLKSAEEYAAKHGVAMDIATGVWEQYSSRQETVMANAANAYKTAGMSANEYMNTVNGFAASLTSSLGEYEWQAASYADMIVTDMADNANKMGTSLESIQTAYAGFSKQNYTMLDNLKLGYGGTKTEMERLMRDAEKYAGYIEGSLSIDSFADVAEAINIVQQELGITGTTAKEASATIQGSISTMKSAWSNFVTGMADENQDFDALFGNLVDSIVTVADNLIPRIQILAPRLVEGVSQLVSTLVPMLPPMVESVLPALVNGAVGLMNGLVAAAPALIAALMAVLPSLINGVMQIVQNIADLLPTLLPLLISATVQLVVALAAALPDIAMAVIEAIPAIVVSVADACIEAAPVLIEAWVTMWNDISEKINKIAEEIDEWVGEKFTALKEKAIEIWEQLKSAAAEKWESIKTSISSKVDEVKSAISEKFEAIKTSISDAFEQAKEKVSEIWDNIKSVFSDALSVGQKIVDDIKQGISNAWAELTGWFSGLWDSLFGGRTVDVSVNASSNVSGKTAIHGSHASGLDYVPFDGYIAQLHKGEMVVPAAEAQMIRDESNSADNSKVANLLALILEAIEEGNKQGHVIKLNNRELGRTVRSYV